MNKPIRTMSIFCLLLFVSLLANTTYLQYVKAGDLDDNSRNRRVIEAAFARDRGAIIVGREAVAESTKVDDRYEFQRRYPQPLRYAHVTGWFSYFSQSGIERSQNEVLSGDHPSLFVRRLVDMLSNTEPEGGSVQLTLDADAQNAAYDGLLALGADTQGAVVAIEPSTGRILAMVSTPSFDPNQLAGHNFGKVLDADKRLNNREDEPKLNRSIQTALPPGSTFKLVTAAAALESGKYDADTPVPGGPTYQLPHTDTVLNNGGRACGTDKITMTQALEQSCNTTFLALAAELGQERMQAQAEAFGFNSTALEDLPGQAASVYPTDQDLEQSYLAQTGIGQYDVKATPLQMAMVVSAIANGGLLMRPYIVDEIRSANFDTLKKTEPQELSEAMSSSAARDLTTMLVSVVDRGTARPAAIPGVQVAGKTGTAQAGREDIGNYAWFVSFAPADDPKVAVAVMIQNAHVPNDDVSGSGLAGPIARAVMEAVIQ